MVSKLKEVAEDKRNGGLKKKKKCEPQGTHVVVTRHELGSSSMQSERSTTKLPELLNILRAKLYIQIYL